MFYSVFVLITKLPYWYSHWTWHSEHFIHSPIAYTSGGEGVYWWVTKKTYVLMIKRCQYMKITANPPTNFCKIHSAYKKYGVHISSIWNGREKSEQWCKWFSLIFIDGIANAKLFEFSHEHSTKSDSKWILISLEMRKFYLYAFQMHQLKFNTIY